MKQEQRNNLIGLTVILFVIVVGGAVFVYRLYFPLKSGYTIAIVGIRATRKDLKPVDLSLWIYDGKDKLIKDIFFPDKLDPKKTGVSWYQIKDMAPAAIPRSAISADNIFQFTIKLNPNRLGTPPDAIFRGRLALPSAEDDASKAQDSVIRSLEKGDYEIGIRIGVRS